MVPEYRRGRIELNGDILDLAVYNKGKFATYHAARYNRVLWDLNGDGVFDNETESAECYRDIEPFNINGVAMKVARISPLGDELVLKNLDPGIAPKRKVNRGDLAPAFSVVDMAGSELSLSDFKGQYVLLDFWSTGCGPCLRDTPLLKAVHEKFAGDLTIIGISDDERRGAVTRYVSENGVGWAQVMDKTDNGEQLKKLYNISGWPKYFLIDPEGKVVAGSDLLRGAIEPVLYAWLL